MPYRKPELLSPAGNMDCLMAALAGGCDAVYAGCDRFGARAYAGNFTPEEFVEAIDRMHIFGKKIYLTLNTLIKPEEFKDIHDFVKPFHEAGLDGVIVQDMGVIRLLNTEFKGMEIHASTQMSVSSKYGARLLKDQGVSRIVTSRELSVKEIKEISRETGMELECFIHGAMCYSYSGMCLMSSFLGGRSGNRGRCAGPCRQPYSAGRIKDKYLLSMKDMCALDILDELMEAGISSFKIEGRMKSPAYVYGVTEIYRRNIDEILAGDRKGYRPSDEDRKHLQELYSRGGISDGYYHRRNGACMITMEKGGYKREDKDESAIERPRFPLRADLRAYAGERLCLTVETCGEPVSSVCVNGEIVSKADKRPMSEADFFKPLNKTGGSDFVFEDIAVDTDGMSFVQIRDINSLRRRALELMKERLTNDHKRCL